MPAGIPIICWSQVTLIVADSCIKANCNIVKGLISEIQKHPYFPDDFDWDSSVCLKLSTGFIGLDTLGTPRGTLIS